MDGRHSIITFVGAFGLQRFYLLGRFLVRHSSPGKMEDGWAHHQGGSAIHFHHEPNLDGIFENAFSQPRRSKFVPKRAKTALPGLTHLILPYYVFNETK